MGVGLGVDEVVMEEGGAVVDCMADGVDDGRGESDRFVEFVEIVWLGRGIILGIALAAVLVVAAVDVEAYGSLRAAAGATASLISCSG